MFMVLTMARPKFLLPPSLDELKHRLMKRGTEEMDEQQLRLLRSLQELDYLREYHFFVVNVEVNQAVENIMKILSLGITKKRRYF